MEGFFPKVHYAEASGWNDGAHCGRGVRIGSWEALAGKLPVMENRHIDALRRISQADAMWAADGHEPRSFLLMYLGGMEKRIDHPRWDPSWSTPGISTVDGLAELSFLRVSGDPSKNGRAFELTMAGREKAAELFADDAESAPLGCVAGSVGATDGTRSLRRRLPSAPKAFVSWAHGDGDWQSAVAGFAFTLRELGIEADIDLVHLHEPGVDWTTFGQRGIEANEFVVIPVSAGYRQRWEGKAEPGTGAGAAREANVLKALFNEDQEAFRHKVKIVVLPGASSDDIPRELQAIGQHYEISNVDEAGLDDLLRTLAGRPAFVAPPVGRLPMLPPTEVAGTSRQRGSSAPYALPDAIAALPDREKLVIALTYYEHLTRDEIAEILGVPPDEISLLAQRATDALGPAIVANLGNLDPPSPGGRHRAHFALLAGGPYPGERVAIEPGQVTLSMPERFDFDQGHSEVVCHYVYEARTGNDPDTAVFRFTHQEHHVYTESGPSPESTGGRVADPLATLVGDFPVPLRC